MRDIPQVNSITRFIHCELCVRDLAALKESGYPTQSPQAYARLEVGWTEIGVQVFCNRHQVNVAHWDFREST